jgi:transcription antitermination factor NusG
MQNRSGGSLNEDKDQTIAPPWYALYTRHQHEKVIAHSLSTKGFEVFLPLYSAARQWKDRTKQLRLPLFPCYVFLRGELNRWLDVVSTPGIHSLVGSSGRPAIIPEAEIDAVRHVVEGGITMEPHPFLKCGDQVRVRSGVLEGIEGILVRKKNLFRLVLSVQLLEKSVALEVDASTVERVSRPNEASASRRLSTVASARAWA